MRINLCCFLLWSPDVLSKGETVQQLKSVSRKNAQLFPSPNHSAPARPQLMQVEESQSPGWVAETQGHVLASCPACLLCRNYLQCLCQTWCKILVRHVSTYPEKNPSYPLNPRCLLGLVPSLFTLIIGLLSFCCSYRKSPLPLVLTYSHNIL